MLSAVYFTAAKLGGHRWDVACGALAAECTCKKQAELRLNSATRPGPGYYEPLMDKHGAPLGNGRLDRQWFTPEEAHSQLRQAFLKISHGRGHGHPGVRRPSRIGHTYLCATHSLIHPEGMALGRDAEFLPNC